MSKGESPAQPKVPAGLDRWLRDHRAAGERLTDYALFPDSDGKEGARWPFLLTTAPFRELKFEVHKYNPREPNEGKVRELEASIRQLTLLSPLTCAYIEKGETDVSTGKTERIVLIDGRHRFKALQNLSGDRAWADSARIDLKVYWNLEKSDLHLLATYLNRTRRALKRGEYYRAIVEIYENRLSEILEQTGKTPTEDEVFKSIHARELTDKDFDLSVGRVVGLTAFDKEELDSWCPLVGLGQRQPIQEPLGDVTDAYCPMTAGVLAEFLRPLCQTSAYSDKGRRRSAEIDNVLDLGRVFRKTKLLQPVLNFKIQTATSVGCKYWCMVAFGELIACSTEVYPEDRGDSAPLALDDQDWKAYAKLVSSYRDVMEGQAKFVNDNPEGTNLALLNKAWSYQTVKGKVKANLRKELTDRGFSFRDEE